MPGLGLVNEMVAGHLLICLQFQFSLPNHPLMFFFFLVEARKIESAGGYSFTVTAVPNTFNFRSP